MDYSALWDELTNDPAAVGYVAPNNPANDVENAGLINDETQTVERMSITAAELWENTDLTEYRVLGIEARDAYNVLVGLETIDVAEGSNSRTALANLFPAGTTTRANLVALVQETRTVSRASQLGFGRVYVHDIETARDRYSGA